MLISEVLLPVPDSGLSTGNIRSESSTCRDQYSLAEMSPVCTQVCLGCHDATTPIEPLDIYTEGDLGLCMRCHEEKATPGPNTLLLRPVTGAEEITRSGSSTAR